MPDFLSFDLIVIGAFLIAVLAWSYTFGKDYGVTMILALYMAAFPFFFVPQVIDMIPTVGLPEEFAKLIFFGALWLLTFFILMRNGFFESPMVPALWEIGVFAILFTGFACVIVSTFLPPEMISGFSMITQAAFTGDVMLTFWAMAPIGFWILIRGD